MSRTSPAQAAPQVTVADGPVFRTVLLDTPVRRGDQVIDQVSLRKPRSGELRGLSLSSLAQLDVDEMRKILPRISDPMLTIADVDGMDPADLLACGAEVVDFLLPKAKRPAYPVE